jgi:hypothetical protein
LINLKYSMIYVSHAHNDLGLDDGLLFFRFLYTFSRSIQILWCRKKSLFNFPFFSFSCRFFSLFASLSRSFSSSWVFQCCWFYKVMPEQVHLIIEDFSILGTFLFIPEGSPP